MNNTTMEWKLSELDWLTITLNIAFGASAVILNSLLLIVLYFDPFNKFRTAGTILVTNLAITDALTGLCVVVRVALFLRGYSLNSIAILHFSSIWAMQCSLFITVLFITWERLIAVVFPIRFKLHVTKTRTFLLSLIGWILSPILLNMSVFVGDYSGRISCITFGCLNLPIIFLVVAGYCFIYKALKKKAETMGRYGEPHETPQNKTKCTKRNVLTENKRLTNTFLAITIILMLTLLPTTIFAIVIAVCPKKCSSMVAGLYYRLEPWFLINYNVNPLVYAFQLPTYRQAILTVFRCRKKREIHPEETRTDENETQHL